MAMMVDNCSPGLRAAWHPVGRIDQLADGLSRVELLGQGYVVVRDGQQITVFEDRCPHRGGRLSDGTVTDGVLACPYHGWRFAGDGGCLLIPALGPGAAIPPRAALTAVEVATRYGLLWIAPQQPVAELAVIGEWDDPQLRPVWLPVVDIRCGAAQFIDNFLDFAHFPFVHAGTFGNSEDPLLDPYTVERGAHGLVVDYQHTITNHEDPLVATGQHPLVQPRRMRYQYTAPFTAVLRLELPLTGVVNAIAVYCQPMTSELTRVYTTMLRNDCSDDIAAAAAVDYELAVLAEDVRIIEALPDRTLDLDAQAQVHTRADRLAVEFRRVLARLLAGQDVAPGSGAAG